MFSWISNLREPLNGFTHIIGAVLSIAAMIILVWRATCEKKPRHILAFSIYGFSQIALYTLSALYHSLTVSLSAIVIFQHVEHAMIYFLIAGTYTPLCLIVLRDKWGWSLLGVNWGLAITGMCLKLTLQHPPQIVSVVLFSFFIIMGWLIIIAWRPLVKTLPKPGIGWLVAGGLFYTFGAIILGMKNLYLGFGFGPHQVWHIFVMAGGACVFWLMHKYVSPLR